MMIDTFPSVRVVVMLAAAALLAAGCDPRNDAATLAQWHGATAAAMANGVAGALGTDESVEDSELTAKVREAILADPQLQSQQIDVDTEDAAVTLKGTVESPSLRERAVQLAGAVDGVAQVQDKLEVRD
jgi:hyperosmotically inducible protein